MIPLNLLFLLFVFHCFQCFKLPDIPKELANKFGPFEIEITNFQLCNGPKRKDLSKTSAKMVKIENSYILYMNMTLLEKFHVDHVKVEVYTLKQNSKSVLWSNRIDDPCKHFALGELFYKYFGISRNCSVLKGDFYYIANLTDITYALYGNSFYYGEFFMKSTVFADKGNIICLHLNEKFVYVSSK